MRTEAGRAWSSCGPGVDSSHQTEEGRLYPESQREHGPADSLAPELRENIFLFLSPPTPTPSLWYLVPAALGNE